MARTLTKTEPKKRSGWDLLESLSPVAARLDLAGLEMPERPEGQRVALPDDLTELDDSSLMKLFGRASAWVEYTGARLSLAEVEEKYADEAIREFEAIGAIKNSSEKTLSAAKAKVYEDPEYLAAKETQRVAYGYRKLAQSIYESADKRCTLISRELTRRVGRDAREGRNGRWNA